MDIEENIKIVKEFNEKHRFRDCGRLNNAIDHILEEIEENRKYTIHLTDEQYRKVIENAQKDIENKYKKKIAELEEHQEKFYNGELYTAKQLKQIEENQKKYFINKQKVKERIKELKLSGGSDGKDNIENLARELAIEICEELLEDK
mgnify:CR=1 FL=1|jgi:hypothetical protein